MTVRTGRGDIPAPEILYEDADITVCIKPAGVSSEPAPGSSLCSMPELLRARWGDPDAFVGIVHRLDTGVGGVMVCARTPAAAAGLSRQIAASRQGTETAFLKEYRAVIAGGPDESFAAQGTLHDWLFKDSRRGKVFAVSRPRKGVREAVLDYQIVRSVPLPGPEAGVFSLVSVLLHTGRTHQIRVQFASRRHPLWGDGKYGSRQKGALALQSARLRFLHPATGRPMDFSVPLPQGMPWNLFL